MEPENKYYSMADLINFSLEDRPADMADAFDALMTGRINDRLDAARLEVAADMAGVENDESEDEELAPEDEVEDEGYEAEDDEEVDETDDVEHEEEEEDAEDAE